MLISHTKKFIFIHNYKVAGTSVRDVLGRYRLSSWARIQQKIGMLPKNHTKISDNHLTALEIRARTPEKWFNTYFKFGFVRNPWDWQASLYEYALKNTKHKQHQIISQMPDFKYYLEWRITEDFKPQAAFFCDEQGQLIVDFVGKYENLHQDFDWIKSKIHIKDNLEHLNKSRDNREYLKYYTPETIDLVWEAYQEDVKLFAYEKPILL